MAVIYNSDPESGGRMLLFDQVIGQSPPPMPDPAQTNPAHLDYCHPDVVGQICLRYPNETTWHNARIARGIPVYPEG